ncbi:hypothetical protein HYALB_00006834 [Hymenoscyphus albidus]|uniref:C2H2-type domain-containing protein n=1 Tax=Hymenoscyphus albidus TaxID=595503 RepID=A0A9N9LER8_9HELO|nr:hypothetical protein HYALB_00006834 [Hymenoscyphus albidus]
MEGTNLQRPGGRQEWAEERERERGATTNDLLSSDRDRDRDVSLETTSASPARSGSSPAGAKRRDGKNSVVPGQRFACTRCSKTYTRIENLTRHQANHEGGKFNCPVCRKSFTRSDLLNRHRRIHNSHPDSNNTSENSNDFPSPSRSAGSYEGGGTPIKQETRGGPLPSPNSILQGQYGEAHHQPPTSNYQAPFQQPTPHSDSLPMMCPGAPNQDLNDLMEAALASQDTLSFTPVENFNPNLWGGFMLFADNSNSYMGSYDADISWTLNSLHSEGSPTNYLDDPNFGDFVLNPYQYQAVSYRQDDVSALDADDAVDEDKNDWPDKPDSQLPRAPRVVPLHLIPTSWQTVLEEARSILFAPNIVGAIRPVNEPLRNELICALDDPTFRNPLSKPQINDAMFPPAEVIEFFLHMYLQHVHSRFSVLHLPTFDIYNTSRHLLLAMCFLGSSHSRMDRGRFSRLFYDHLRLAFLRSSEMDPKSLRITDNILTSFLLCMTGTWSGSKQSYEFAEGARGTLVTTMRRARLLDCRPSSRISVEKYKAPGVSEWDAIWFAWAETEKRKRLGLCIYMFDCQWSALFNCQPYVSKSETTNCVFPCAEDLYEAPTSITWRHLINEPNRSASSYYLHALNACLLHKWVKPAPPIVDTGSDFGKMVLIYAIHTHIFEWRQSTSMLNPTGLMGSFGNSALPIGKGLQERRQWLIDGLDSFQDCYGHSGVSTATTLLHRLAYVALDVSLSDMHLVAGRSNNLHDGNFAEENLKHWANSEMAGTTIGHVFAMLDLCHRTIEYGNVAEASYEVAVCLLTGGIICWAYAKLRVGSQTNECVERVRRAAVGLKGMGCWRMCSTFGRILEGFEVVK